MPVEDMRGRNNEFSNSPPPVPEEVQEAFLRWMSIVHGTAGMTSMWKGLRVVPEYLLDIYQAPSVTDQNITRSYYSYYPVSQEKASDRRFREHYRWKEGAEFAFSKTAVAYFGPLSEGLYPPSMIHWYSEHEEFPYNPDNDEQTLWLQNPQFGDAYKRRNQIRARLGIAKYAELYVEYDLSGTLDNFALTSFPIRDRREPTYKLKGSPVSRGDSVEFDFGGYTYKISPHGGDIFLAREREQKIRDTIVLPGYLDHTDIVNELFNSMTLENPVDAPPQGDYFLYTNLYDTLGIKWQRA